MQFFLSISSVVLYYHFFYLDGTVGAVGEWSTSGLSFVGSIPAQDNYLYGSYSGSGCLCM